MYCAKRCVACRRKGNRLRNISKHSVIEKWMVRERVESTQRRVFAGYVIALRDLRVRVAQVCEWSSDIRIHMSRSAHGYSLDTYKHAFVVLDSKLEKKIHFPTPDKA